jgi:hypothetical protein
VLRRIFKECEREQAKIVALPGRPPKGFADARRNLLDRLRMGGVMADLWLFICDSDLQDRAADFNHLIGQAKKQGIILVCCAAEPEIEAWLVAGNLDKLGDMGKVSWSDLRSRRRFKEEVFRPLIKEHGNPRSKDGGREALMKCALSNYKGLCERCPEIRSLEADVRTALKFL